MVNGKKTVVKKIIRRANAKMKIRSRAEKLKSNVSKLKSKAERMIDQRKSSNSKNKPGTKGSGGYYRVIVRPKTEFETFRYQDVGEKGHIQRLAGQKENGSWATHAWIISKDDAKVQDDTLVAVSSDARRLLDSLESAPEHVRGDIFYAIDKKNIPERSKPTLAQKNARMQNITKAQNSRKR